MVRRGRRGKRAEGAGELEDGGGAAGIVIGSVIDDLAGGGLAHAQVIEVRAEQDGLLGERGIGAAEQADGVVGGGAGRERDELELGGFESEGLELGDDVGGGDEFVVSGAAASAESVGGEERHFAANVGGDAGLGLGGEQGGGEQDEDEGAAHG